MGLIYLATSVSLAYHVIISRTRHKAYIILSLTLLTALLKKSALLMFRYLHAFESTDFQTVHKI